MAHRMPNDVVVGIWSCTPSGPIPKCQAIVDSVFFFIPSFPTTQRVVFACYQSELGSGERLRVQLEAYSPP